MTKSIQYLLAIATITFFSACEKQPITEVIGCDPVELNAGFRIVDKLSGENLFFSDKPKYQIEDIKIYNIRDKTHQKPISLTVIGKGDQRLFLLPIEFSNPIDTMVFEIANTPHDLFIYKYNRTKNPCEGDQIEQLSFNNVAVVPEKGILIFKK